MRNYKIYGNNAHEKCYCLLSSHEINVLKGFYIAGYNFSILYVSSGCIDGIKGISSKLKRKITFLIKVGALKIETNGVSILLSAEHNYPWHKKSHAK